jgi:uncharacterized protein (TIGR00369 family)
MSWSTEHWNNELYMQWAGLRMLEVQDGRSRLELTIEAHHRGGAGTEAVNGAILSYMHDIVQGAAIRSLLPPQQNALATINLHIDYLELLRSERTVVASGKVVGLGRGVAFGESEVRDASGRLCTRCVGTYRVMSHAAT